MKLLILILSLTILALAILLKITLKQNESLITDMEVGY